MTANDIETIARRRYNAIGDTNWSSEEFWNSIDEAQAIVAREALCIEATYTTSTVASQQEYSYPTNTIAIKRITYDGRVLEPIDFDEDDRMTLNNASTTATGTPAYYFLWDGVIYLRPVPSAVGTLKIFSINKPQLITAGTTSLEIPAQFQPGIAHYVLAEMYRKDKDFASGQKYEDKFTAGVVMAAKRWQQKKNRANRFGHVQPEETVSVMDL